MFARTRRECLRVLLGPELHLLRVCQAHALRAMSHRRLLVVGTERQHSDDDKGEHDGDQRPSQNHAEKSLPGGGHDDLLPLRGCVLNLRERSGAASERSPIAFAVNAALSSDEPARGGQRGPAR